MKGSWVREETDVIPKPWKGRKPVGKLKKANPLRSERDRGIKRVDPKE